MSTAWTRKDLLTIRELDRAEIELILDTGRIFKDLLSRPVKKAASLEGRTVVNLFVEPSTRTKTSFELAAVRRCRRRLHRQRVEFLPQGRDAEGHRASARGDEGRFCHPAPFRRRCAAV